MGVSAVVLKWKKSQSFPESSSKSFPVNCMGIIGSYMTIVTPCICILVTTSGYREGILIEAEGYAYPRYAAFMPDCRKIDLEGKEVLAQADLSPNLPMEYWREAEVKKKNERTEGR